MLENPINLSGKISETETQCSACEDFDEYMQLSVNSKSWGPTIKTEFLIPLTLLCNV